MGTLSFHIKFRDKCLNRITTSYNKYTIGKLLEIAPFSIQHEERFTKFELQR